MIELKGLATGIGSLPYKDPDQAVDLVLKYLPSIPFWPQLPKYDFHEGMIAQFSQNIACLKVTPDGVYFDAANQEEELEKFYEQIISHNLEYFRIGPDFAAGLYEFYEKLERPGAKEARFIKCHITGPFTFAASIKDEKGVSLLHDPVFMQVIQKGLIMKALWQIKHFSRFNKKIIIFIDEPYLSAFGSAYTPVNRHEVISCFNEFFGAIKSQDVLTGIHCCGNSDWSIFTDIAGIDIINFDAFGFLDKFILYCDNLKAFLERDGIICWGIVPTQEFTGRETPELLAKKIYSGVDTLAKKGLSKELLLNNLLISPSCGLGSLEGEKPEKIFKLLSELSEFIRSH